ncbi:hypothetical protein [Streptomyces ossamyceticus]|uniref:hypothetical protein n=1 Tax=Streptomyces ossamyceticus TaxID=249581 RepID=UPI0006E2B8BB|nr:hypothetical protein [Streptomyces ossamyceticus]
MNQPPPPESVAVELEKLRGTMAEGFARVDGALALLVQRGDQTDGRLDELESRVDELDNRRWPLPSIGAMVGLTGLVLAALAQLR